MGPPMTVNEPERQVEVDARTTACGKCTSCRKGRPNACRYNQTLGVQHRGARALTERIVVPYQKVILNDT